MTRPPDNVRSRPHDKGGSHKAHTGLPTGTPDPTSEVAAAADIRDAAARLSLRAAGLGYVDIDDLLDLVQATGRLCDVMMGGTS
jgi:hypothetical protein